MNSSVSYSTFQRYLTSVCESIMEEEERDGVYCPPQIKDCNFIHCAIDNADWHEKTSDGTTFHAMTINAYGYLDENRQDTNRTIDESEKSDNTDEPMTAQNDQPTIKGEFNTIPIMKDTRNKRRSVSTLGWQNIKERHLNLTDRRMARTVLQRNKRKVEDILTQSGMCLDNLQLAWQFGRMCPTKLLKIEIDDFPGWSVFFSKLSPVVNATQIGYGPMIPSSPTDASVVHTGIEYVVKLSRKFGMSNPIVTADQAIYDIAFGLRNKAQPDDPVYTRLILILGAFHIVCNFLKCIGKIMRNCGAEVVVTRAKVCKEGTANKIFGSGEDYYQAMRLHKILQSAVITLHTEEFEEWCITNDKGIGSHVFDTLTDYLSSMSDILDNEDNAEDLSVYDSASLHELRSLIEEFNDISKQHPTHTFWVNYIKMIDILLKCTAAQRSGQWEGFLSSVGQMIPYVVASGHHNYATALPLFLCEMKDLKNKAPDVYAQFQRGNFVVRRTKGRFNAVPTDMALEQTYNKDVKESASGLTGITLDDKARTKWLYTKPVTSAISSQFKDMLDLKNSPKEFSHHDEGSQSLIAETANCMKQMINPFTIKGSDLINIASGEKASDEIRNDLTKTEQVDI